MFLHVFKYAGKGLLRTKEVMFWSLVFPFALSTFMYLAFGDIFEATEKFHVIPIAVVKEEQDIVMEQFLTAISEGDESLVDVTWADSQKADELLADEEVTGILYEREDCYLKVRESGMDETILQMMLRQFCQRKQAITDVATLHPERIMEAVERMNRDVQYIVQKKYGSGNQDNLVNYFYAIIAMTCLFASFSSCDRICKLQADASDIGIRRNVAPTHKMTVILAEFFLCESIQFILSCLLFIYLKFILNINIGDQYAALLLLLFLGTSLGTMFGIFIGSLPKVSAGMKIGILVSVSLFLCACSDLMVAGIRDWIEHHLPIVNDINPAALICDSFYALNVYDTYERFAGNMVLLAVITLLLGAGGFVLVRRKKYASL